MESVQLKEELNSKQKELKQLKKRRNTNSANENTSGNSYDNTTLSTAATFSSEAAIINNNIDTFNEIREYITDCASDCASSYSYTIPRWNIDNLINANAVATITGI